jgi:hypothetical protein
LLMFKITSPLWKHFPELRYVQLPWRWLLCLNVVFALALVTSFTRWWSRLAVCALALASIVVVWNRIQTPWWDSGADLQEMADNQHEGVGNEGTDEYVPVGVDPYDADKNAPLARVAGKQSAEVQVQKWDAEHRLITETSSTAGKLILKTFNYPSWRAKVNGTGVAHESIPNTGEIALTVPAGRNVIELNFMEGLDRTIGALISFIALAITCGWYLFRRVPA